MWFALLFDNRLMKRQSAADRHVVNEASPATFKQ